LNQATWRGLGLAGLIHLGWLASLLLLWVNLAQLPATVVVVVVLVRTFLQTGLFIVGHDAIHGVLVPGRRRMNDGIGQLALGLYAGLPYGLMRRKHRLHHRHPGSPLDPDFHARGQGAPWLWYGQFMARYLRPAQMTWLLASWATLALLASVPAVLLLCTLPLLLSSLQLFLVGTYLPHRHQARCNNSHHAVSLELPVWLSLLACYHFGYHLEHHQAPELAWHQLPQARGS
jgi:beta-carotene ketolase (CrtW type)